MAWAAPSETDVANMAVDVLDDFPIASLSEDTPVGRFMNRNFWRVYDDVAFAYPWSFLKARAALSADPTAPAFDWTYRYAWPDEAIRILPLRVSGQWNNLPIPHEIEGRYILTNQIAPLNVNYLARVENVGLWPAPFVRITAMTLALYGALNITGKAGYVDKAKGLLQMAVEAGTHAESLSSGTPEAQNRHDVVNVRGAGLAAPGGFIRYPTTP